MVVSASHFKDVVNGYEKRTDGLWVHTGKLKVSGPLEVTGAVKLPVGTAQALIGSYSSSTTWSTSATGTWLETPVGVTATFTGSPVRIELVTVFMHTVATGYWYTAYGMDGVVQIGLSLVNTPFAGANTPISWVWYVTPPAGSHRMALFVNNGTAGILTIQAGIQTCLFVTEQRA